MISYMIRPATLDDLSVLVRFTIDEALHAEGTHLDAEAVQRGVRAGLQDPAIARYWVACAEDGLVVGSISSTREWSDWRGGDYWLVQSVYIGSDHRGTGLVDRLLETVATVAAAEQGLELRLLVHEDNARALGAYRRNGFTRSPYVVMSRPIGGHPTGTED